MSITNDERREVAARLRYVAEHGAPEWETTACCIAECIGEDDYPLWSGSGPLFSKLADLIEPEERKCRVVTDKNTVSQTQEVHTKYCSKCSYVFGREQHRPLLPGLDEEIVLHAVQIPDYCPGCGAKVTEVGQ